MRTGLRQSFGLVAVSVVMALASTGCVKQMLLDGQLESTRKAASAVQSIGDFEVARAAAFGSLGTLEGLHRLAPETADGLFLLTNAWAGAGFSFIEDDWETVEDAGDEDLAGHHRTRARAA